jgi:hypothetical protein
MLFVKITRQAFGKMFSWKEKTSLTMDFFSFQRLIYGSHRGTRMNSHDTQTRISEDHQPGGAENTRLYGRQLMTERSVWITLVVLTLTVFFVLFRKYVALEAGQILPDLRFFGGSFAATIILTIVSMLLCFAVTLVIFWRKSNDWMALLVALMHVMLGKVMLYDGQQRAAFCSAHQRVP